MGKLWVVAAAVLMLSGCASIGTKYDSAVADTIQPGAPQSEVIAKLGPPNSETTMANGRRLLLWMFTESNGMTGKSHSQMVSFLFDSDGHMIRQVSKTQTNMKLN